MPVGPQYSSEFGKTSGSMNGLQVLAGAERAELALRVAQAERGLALVDAGAEQLELEGRLEVAERVGVDDLNAEPALADAGERAVVVAELVLRTTAAWSRACVSNQSGLICLKLWPMSSIAKP